MSELAAGRELDALIGEYVFGWEKGSFPVYEPMKSKHGDYMVRPISEYSADIAAAWDVVEKMTDRGFLIRLTVDGKNEFWCAFKFSATAKTAPLAICRAALLAVMEK